MPPCGTLISLLILNLIPLIRDFNLLLLTLISLWGHTFLCSRYSRPLVLTTNQNLLNMDAQRLIFITMSWWTGDIRNYSNEEFHGYFSDIRLVALRTLPRKPPKEILSLLRTTSVHSPYAQAESALATPSSIQSTREFSFLPETTEFAYSPNHDLHLDLGTPSTTEERFSYFPVSARTRLHKWQQLNDDESRKSSDGSKKSSIFQKFAYGMAVYVAIALLALIVIVGILVTSLKTLDNNINEMKKVSISKFIDLINHNVTSIIL